jgi:hypothetical protein
MIAGIAVRSHPHVNERTAKTRLQIAAGIMRAAGWRTGRGVDGGMVSSPIAPLYEPTGKIKTVSSLPLCEG